MKRVPDTVRTGFTRHTRGGFTIVELVLIVAVLAILASIAIPRMGWGTMGKIEAETAARQFSNYLRLARSLAITHASSNGEGYKVALAQLKVKQVIQAGILAAMKPVKPVKPIKPAKPVPLSYTSYSIINASTSEVVKGPIGIPKDVTCTGDDVFQFTPLGQLKDGSTLTLQFSKSGGTTVVTVTPVGRITVQ